MSAPAERLTFEALYVEYAAYVRRVLLQRGVRAADVDDVLQEAFTTIHRLWPDFEGRSKVETWLYAIAWRFAAQYRRRHRLELSSTYEPAADETSGPMFEAGRMYDALHRIDDEERDLILLHDIGGLSISALAELTGHARATIRERLERGRAALVRDSYAVELSLPRVDALEAPPARYRQLHDDDEPFMKVMSRHTACFSILEDIVMVVWRGHTSVEAIETSHQLLRDLAEQYPQGVRYLSIIEPTSTPPNRQGRKLQAWMMREHGPKLRAVVGVIDDSVLMQVATAILNSYAFFVRTPLNMRFFTRTDSALAWLGQYGATDPRLILARLAAMRARLDREKM